MNPTQHPSARALRPIRRVALLALALGLPSKVPAQAPVPVGAGSYASSIPPAYQFSGGFFSMTAQQVVTQYANLKVDSALTNRPMPTSQWWTDLLVGDRSYQPAPDTPRVLQQDPFGGQLWVDPLMLDPESFGFNLHVPNSWTPRSNPNVPEGGFNPGPALPIRGVVPTALGSNDVLIANFEGTSYPPGWTTTGTAFRTGPYPGGGGACQVPNVQGFIGNACVNSFLCSDAPTGTLSSPAFTITNPYIHLLAGGGVDTNLTAVRLVVSNQVVRTAVGQQDGTLRWHAWNVSAYAGQTAHIQIVDLSSGGWGFILCDFIVASDDGSDPAARYSDSFQPQRSVVTGWSDWGLQFALPDAGGRRMDVTVARGVPFLWTTCSNVNPRIQLGAATTVYDTNGAAIPRSDGGLFTNAAFAFDYSGRVIGVFTPDNTPVLTDGDSVVPQLSGTNNFVVYAALPAVSSLAEFAGHGYACVTNTTYSWSYDIAHGQVVTTWDLATSPLRGGQTNTLQGWLPHHYRTTSNSLAFKPYTYPTPRGVARVAAGNRFQLGYSFRGLAPVIPAPRTNGLPDDYIASRMTNYVNAFAASYPFNVGDTYGAGKTFGLTAQYLSFARQLGMTNQVAQLAAGLRSLLENWFTYTPGEADSFFARYDNWRALIGFPASYGSEAFNDNHFHYGYFMAAAALLGMEDPAFLSQYGPMAKHVAREYANWDRTETDYPFLRVFDVWEGHSSAGGFGSAGGNNQESSSESMNAWVGLFLLGNLLDDADMTAAGAMGYAVESAAVNEYWQDMYRTSLPASYGKGMVGILWSGAASYGTFFSGDPAWIHGIQWVPANHWNSYLCRDKTFAHWQLTNLWNERVVADTHGINGFTLADANNVVAQGEYLGNYILGFQLLFDPDGVAAIVEAAFATNAPIAIGPNYAGATYYLTHALRALGDPDPDWHTSLPTSQVYYNAATGRRTYVLYNPAPTNRTVTVFQNGVAVETVTAPARQLASLFTAPTNDVQLSIRPGAQIAWPTVPDSQYQLQWRPVGGTTWTDLGAATAGSGATQSVFEAASLAAQRDYRVLESAPGSVSSLFQNGSFEDGGGTLASHWVQGGSQPSVRVTGDARSGNAALRLYVTNSTSTPNTSDLAQDLAAAGSAVIVPGTAHTLSFWAKSIASGPSYVQNYGVSWRNTHNAQVGFSGWTGFAAGAGTWLNTRVTNLVAPANAVNAVLQIYGTTGAVAGGYGGALIDDVLFGPPADPTTNVLSPGILSGVQLSWPAEAGSYHQLEKRVLLATPDDWFPLYATQGNGGWQWVFDAYSTNASSFYRVHRAP